MAKAVENIEELFPRAERRPEPTRVRIDTSPVAITTTITSLALLIGSGFQVGYFISVGIEFLPLLSAVDLLFPVAALVPWTFLWYPPVSLLCRRMTRHVKEGSWERSGTWWLTLNFAKYELAILWLCILVAVFAGVQLFELVRWGGIPALMVLVTINASLLKDQALHDGKLLVRTCFWFSLNTGLLAMGTGALYADYFAGKHCWLRTSDASYVWDATYLRPLGEGHLIKYAGRTVFLAKGEVREVTCGRFRPQHRPGEPLKAPPSN